MAGPERSGREAARETETLRNGFIVHILDTHRDTSSVDIYIDIEIYIDLKIAMYVL